MSKKLLIVLANSDPENPEEFSAPLFQAMVAAAMQHSVEVVFTGGQPDRSGDKDTLYKIHRDAASFYHRLLMEGSEGADARRYLEERDLPPEVISGFQIVFAPNEWDGLM